MGPSGKAGIELRRPVLWCLALVLGAAMAGCLPGERIIFSTDRELQFPAAASALAPEEVLFPARDGVRLYGWYLAGSPGRPLVLFLHGTSTNLSRQVENLSLLQELGVSVFVFDYRGYGQSRGVPSERGTYEDARGALAYLRSRGWEPERMVYFGRSLGAAVAIQLALEEPPAGMILESPFTSILAMICHHSPVPCTLLRWVSRNYYDNLEKIGRVDAPLLIFQGDRDTVVPVAMARELFERAPEPKTLHILPGAGHTDTYRTGGAPYWESWRRFLEATAPGSERRAGAR